MIATIDSSTQGLYSIEEVENDLKDSTYYENDKFAKLGKLELAVVDMHSFQSIKRFANKVKKDLFLKKLDILILNEDSFSAEFNLTAHGIEFDFAVNYLSQFLLTKLLLNKVFPDKLQITALITHRNFSPNLCILESPLFSPSVFSLVIDDFSFCLSVFSTIKVKKSKTRVLISVNYAYKKSYPDGIAFDRLKSANGFSKTHAYGQSKLALIYLVSELFRELRYRSKYFSVSVILFIFESLTHCACSTSLTYCACSTPYSEDLVRL